MGSTAAPGYRPHLDGLRALAVYLVVAFHAGSHRLGGGFIGVDLFFVLSGYLVTGVLRRDREAAGRRRLVRFYARRVRRLLPAAIVALVVTAVAYSAVASGAQIDDARGAMQAAALYVSNWYFVAQSTDYFAAGIEANPVLHFWSLSVEEQFYLAWPLLLAGAWRATRRWRAGPALVGAACVVGAAASAAWALSLRDGELARAYYGTDTRAYQLLAGASLALLPALPDRLRSIRALGWAGTAGVAAVLFAATSWVDVDPVERGMLAALGSVVAIFALDHGPRSAATAVLGLRPVAFLGRVSYGTYLWHWPIIVIWRELGDPPSSAVLAVATAVMATAVATVSHVLLESPLRTSAALDRRPVLVVVGGLAVSAIAGLLVLPGLLSPESASRAATAVVAAGVLVVVGLLVVRWRRRIGGREHLGRLAVAACAITAVVGVVAPGAQPAPEEAGDTAVDWRAARDDLVPATTCTAADLDSCVVRDGDGPTALLLGDSHALMLIPAVAAAAEALDLRFVAAASPACPWYLGVNGILFANACVDAQEDWFGPVLETFDPDIVLLAQRRSDDPGAPVTMELRGQPWVSTGDPGLEAFIEERTMATLEVLRSPGRRVVFIEGVPQPPGGADPIECLSRPGDPADCGFDAAPSGAQDEFLRGLAVGDGSIWSLDIDPLVCPDLPRCEAVVDGEVVWRDQTHLTATYSASLGPALTRLLIDEGVVAGV